MVALEVPNDDPEKGDNYVNVWEVNNMILCFESFDDNI